MSEQEENDLAESYSKVGPLNTIIETQFGIASGNCLAKGTMVYSNPRGPVEVETLDSGDEVLSFEGTIRIGDRGKNIFDAQLVKRKVIASWSNGIRETFSVRTRTRTVIATGNHPFLVLVAEPKIPAKSTHKYKLSLSWIPASELKPSDAIVCVSSIPEFRSELQVEDPELMRLYGCYLGDGFVSSRHKGQVYGFSLALPLSDPCRQFYDDLIKRKLHPVTRIDKRDGWISVDSKAASSWITEKGFGGTALFKTIPSWVFSQPLDGRIAFIDGYIDADAHRYPDGNSSFESPNEKLIRQIRHMCISVGWRTTNIYRRRRSHFQIIKGHTTYSGPSWGFHITNVNPRFRRFTGSETRPAGRGIHHQLFTFEKVIDVKYAGQRETFDLEVEGSHNFVAEGVIVHNTRHKQVPEWPRRLIHARDKYHHFQIAVAGNIYYAKPEQWWIDIVNQAAKELEKQGVKKGEIAERMIKDFGLTKSRLYRYLAEEYKDPDKVKAGKASAEVRSVPTEGTENGIRLVGREPTYPVFASEHQRRSMTPWQTKLFNAFQGQGFTLDIEYPIPMPKWKCGKCRREYKESADEPPPVECPKCDVQLEQLTYKVDILLDRRWGVEPGGKKHDFESDKERDDFLLDYGIKIYHYDNKLIDAKGAWLIVERHRLIKRLEVPEEHSLVVDGHTRHVYLDKNELMNGVFNTTGPSTIKVIHHR